MNTPTIFEAYHEFQLDLEADGLAPRTRAWYAETLKGFLGAFGTRRIDELDHATLRDFVLTIRRTAKSSHTAHGKIRGLHRFHQWLVIRYGVKNPMAGIKRPRLPEARPKAASAADVLAMFKACPISWLGYRDRALLIFLADTGVRSAGIRNLRVQDVDIDKRRAIIRGEKTRRSRAVPFSQLTATLLRDWMIRLPINVEFLFCTREGKQLKHSGLRQILRRLASKAGVTGRFNPHSFRHFAAREYLTNGGDLATAARLLGHQDVSTTAHYYAVHSDDEVQERHDKHSPVRSVFNGRNKQEPI